jgi:hypothetical protein
VNEAEIILIMKVEASRNPTELLQPREQPLELPAAFVTAQHSAVLRCCFLPIRLVRRNHLETLLSQLFVERVGVISLISNQPLREFRGQTLKESICDKSDFMRRSTLRVDGAWKTSRVCHCHELRACAPLRLSHFCAPF